VTVGVCVCVFLYEYVSISSCKERVREDTRLIKPAQGKLQAPRRSLQESFHANPWNLLS
jgi:hypothetical protein